MGENLSSPIETRLSIKCLYRLGWNGLVMAYTADSEPSTFEAEQSKGADVFIHGDKLLGLRVSCASPNWSVLKKC